MFTLTGTHWQYNFIESVSSLESDSLFVNEPWEIAKINELARRIHMSSEVFVVGIVQILQFFWKENEDPLPDDELPEWKREQPKIDLSQINPNDPESMLRATKKGKTLMMFASVSGNNSLVITARKRSFGHGNVFTPVCHSVQGVGRETLMMFASVSGGHLPTPWMQTPPPDADLPRMETPPWMRDPSTPIRSKMGRYASYWNAYLYLSVIIIICKTKVVIATCISVRHILNWLAVGVASYRFRVHFHIPSTSLFFVPFKYGLNAVLWCCFRLTSKRSKVRLTKLVTLTVRVNEP